MALRRYLAHGSPSSTALYRLSLPRWCAACGSQRTCATVPPPPSTGPSLSPHVGPNASAAFLFDVLAGPAGASPSQPGPRTVAKEAKVKDKPASSQQKGSDTPAEENRVPGWEADGEVPWAQHIRQVVREAVLEPAEAQRAAEAIVLNTRELRQEDVDPRYRAMVVDALGMPCELPAESPRSFQDLLGLAPQILREQLSALMKRKGYQTLTSVQAAAIPLMLEHRDLLCIAPTATGKTLCYVYASMLRLLLSDTGQRTAIEAGTKEDDAPAASIDRRQVESLFQEKIEKGEVCPYCELSIATAPVCALTGLPHPSLSDMDTSLALRSKERRAMRLEELRASVAEPRVLVLVPNSQLVNQVHSVFRSLHCDYKIHYMVRASSPEEQRRYLQALESGVDVLVCSPETILPALYKHKLSLKRVQTVVMDEVDDIVSVNHFEPLKIILGALPKGSLRPQRLLMGASLPPAAYEMIKTKMLLSAHRFVLVDLKAPSAVSVPGADSGTVLVSSASMPHEERTDTSSSAQVGFLTSRAQLRHLVLMVGRAEKVQRLAWLYQTGKLSLDQRTLVFCNSRHNVAYVRDKLHALVPGLHITTLTSHASATARDGVLKMFSTGVSTCLVCTDLLSRGIDFQNVVYVVHYDMPNDMETWMHRCGRCARGGALNGHGYVYTFFQPENVKLAKPLVAHLRQHKQLIPPKLQEYAKQSFIELFNNSLFHNPTRPYRKGDPQQSTPVMGRGVRRYPDYKQGNIHKHFRPQ